MMPIWIGIDIGPSVPIQAIIASLAVAVIIGRSDLRITGFEAYFAGFLAISLAAVWLAGSSEALWLQFPIRWAIPYLAARVLVAATGARFTFDIIAIFFALVGGLALAELFFAWHPFIGWATDSEEFTRWSSIQTRGGSDRSEWAFGHSIALGASLAMAIPFVLHSSYRPIAKLALLSFVLGGILASGSRGSLLTAGITLSICLLYRLRNTFQRTAVIMATLLGGVLALPEIMPAIASLTLSSVEEQQSFAYRGYLYSSFLTAIEWFGESPSANLTREGTDSAFIHLGLRFGWVILTIVLIPLAVSTFRVVAGRASVAEISIVCQIPIFAAVAFITQYQLWVFFVAGLAVQLYIQGKAVTIKDFSKSRRHQSGAGIHSFRNALRDG
jgi:hypothetical protein